MGDMAIEVTDLAKRKALLWEVVKMMIMRQGPNWRDHLDSIQCDSVEELLAPLGSIEDWATRAYEEMDEARLAGDNSVRQDRRAYIFAQIIAGGGVRYH